MAYNSGKGTQKFGDINFEGDPAETQIDFEDDLIALKTNNLQRLIVSSSAITASVIFSASAGIYAGAFYGDGSGLTSTAAGSTTQVQYNSAGAMAGSSNLTFNGTTLTGSMTGSLAEFSIVVAGGLTVKDNTTLGNASGDSVTINAATVDIPNVAAGTDNTVVIYNGSTLLTDEIDSRVWGSTLVDASGTPVANQIARWSDADTVQGLTTLTYNGAILAVTGAISASTSITSLGSIQALTYVTASAFYMHTISGSGNISGSAFYGDATNLTGLPVAPISTYNNAADNRVITSVDASTVQGEANLTFDGTALTVLGKISGSGALHNVGATTIAGLLAVTGSTTVSGNLGVGFLPTAPLDVNGSTAPLIRFANVADDANGALVKLLNSRGGASAGQADDFAGGVVFNANDNVPNETQYGKISTKIGSPTNTSETGYMLFEVTTGGTSATTYLRLDGPTSAITASMNTLIDANLSVSGNLGIGIPTPLYDLHVNGAGATVATIDGGASSDAFLRFATNGTLKSYVKQGSGGNLIMSNEGSGGSVLFKASPGGVETTYITLDGGTTEVVSSVNTVVQGGTHLSGSVRSMYTFKTTDYTLTSTDHIAIFNAGSPSTATLPLITTSLNGVTYTLKSTGTANITVTGSAGVDQFIDGGQTFIVEQGDAVTLLGFAGVSGFEWAVINFYNMTP